MDNNKKETTSIDKKIDIGSQDDLKGQIVGDYKITKEIGRGGMAVVYEAYQISLDRNVALKVIPRSLVEEPEYLERFKREAASAAKLSHPNIVSIHGFGQIDKTYYYIMDLAKGKTLDKIIEGKKHELLKSAKQFTVEDALKIIEQAGSALSYAHKEGLIHRDIKPGNIMIDSESGRVLITDFGLAKSKKWERITPKASLFGTPAYMSPEQASGKELDHRTDIYSLGAVLYEMLSGSMPFTGNNALEVIDKVKADPIIPPTKFNNSIPHGIESIILKAMSKDTRLRYQSMDEFISDIQRFRKGDKITTYIRIAQKKVEHEKAVKRNIRLLPLYIFIAISIIFGIVLWLNYTRKIKVGKYLNSKFQLADNYEQLGMKDEAVKVYREIIDDFPSSKYAAQAKDRLNK